MRALILALACVLLSATAQAQIQTEAQAPLEISIVPQFPLEQLASTWNPLLREITRTTGMRFTLRNYASIPAFEEAFLRGQPDLAFVNPYHAVMARKAAGYLPILRNDGERLTGLLVVRKDSGITSLKQLDGAIIAFPAPNAFGASLYMRALLAEQAHLHITPVYRSTHPNVFRHVITGSAQAGGVIRQTFDHETAEVRDQLRVLYETPPAYPHPLVAHPRVPPKVRQALQEAFIKLATSVEGARLLEGIHMRVPVRANYANYQPLEKLGLERYVVLKTD